MDAKRAFHDNANMAFDLASDKEKGGLKSSVRELLD